MFTKRLNGFQCRLQILASFFQAIFQKARHVFLVIGIERAGSVILHRTFKAFEQVFVINDVAVILILAVQPVYPADGLKQAVVLHLFVNVEKRRRGRIEAGQQFVHDDDQLQLIRLLDEFLFHRQLELLNLFDGFFFRLIEPVRQHLFVNVVLPEFFGQPFAAFFAFDGGSRR